MAPSGPLDNVSGRELEEGGMYVQIVCELYCCAMLEKRTSTKSLIRSKKD